MLGQNYFIRKAIARCPLALHHSHDVKEQSVLVAILASNELPVMAMNGPSAAQNLRLLRPRKQTKLRVAAGVRS